MNDDLSLPPVDVEAPTAARIGRAARAELRRAHRSTWDAVEAALVGAGSVALASWALALVLP